MQQQVIDLLNYGFTLAKWLLKEQDGEFYPIAVYSDRIGKSIQYLANYGDDFPLSTELIKQLEADLKQMLAQKDLIAYAIIYDTLITNAHGDKSDVLVAKFYSTENQSGGHYYLPYKSEANEVVFLEGWVEFYDRF
ncbi:hypothetical protein [Pedobacter soli]|uniref:Uncharacterized protein n=1 Tax=Pedobacter soli TaxID=390242 RepID=A0A1G6Q3A9_9SPHI|nr:hypothetical protein [Pedobacter soli]SDC86731.1 hypothetical protein SAMN04488024_103228 [Pedobacter soli]